MNDVPAATPVEDDIAPLNGHAPFKMSLPVNKLSRACAACEFGVKEGNDLVCRKNPPQATFLLVPQMVPTPSGPRQGMQPMPFCVFPIVQPDQWCGQFEKRGS